MNLLNPNPRPYPFGPSSLADIFEGSDPSSLALVDRNEPWTYGELEKVVGRRASEFTDRFVFGTGENSAELVIDFLACQRAGCVWVGLSPTLSQTARNELRERVASATDLPDDLAAIAFTSGTTGTPKGVMHSQHSMLAPGLASIEEDPPLDGERIGTPLSLCILNMMLLGPVSALLRRSTAVIMDRTWSAGFAEDVRANRVTRALVVPTMIHDLAHDDSVVNLDPLKTVISGGAGTSQDLLATFEVKFGLRPIRRWGFTEAPTGVVTDGRPLPHVEVVELDGELCVRPRSDGPWAGCFTGALGYLDDPEATEQLFRNAVLHTGDAGSIDEHGVVSVTGRLSEMIIRGGANVDPAEVEAALIALDGIDEAVVVGLPDARLGQVVAAAFSGTLTSEGAAAGVSGRVPTHAIPERWRTTDELPRNAMGKVDRAAVRQLFHDRTSP